MLEQVKQYIEKLPDTSFADYYQQYIFSIQDQNIELEKFSGQTFNNINKLLSTIHRELGNIHDS